MPRSAQSSLSHCTITRPGMLAGSSGTTSSRRPAAITMPPECCPRCRGKFKSSVAISASRRVRCSVTGKPAIFKYAPSDDSGSAWTHPGNTLDTRESCSSENPSARPQVRMARRGR